MLYADYNFLNVDNIVYTVDMIRLKCMINSETYSRFESRLKTVYPDYIKNYYISTGISDFKYNYLIEIREGSSFWVGYIHNSELINKTGSLQNENTKFNFTFEFNPNKVELKGILLYLVHMCSAHDCIIKSVDLAMDVPFNILDICGFDKGRKKDFRVFSQGGDNRTYYIGRTNNRVKIYNKKRESSLDRELTRIEITSKLDLELKHYDRFYYNVSLPKLYLNNYLLTFDDLEDKTLQAILYAVQSGYPVSDLSRRYKDKIEKKLLAGGQMLPLKNIACTTAIRQCIQGIFYPNMIC